ncbi:hypothetical protein J7L05_12145 [bacterium]|nr:hypothetical protein [bacterium]
MKIHNSYKLLIILSLIIITGCGGSNKADEKVKAMAQKVKQGLDEYARDTNGIYPSELDAMVESGYLIDLFDDHFKIPDFTTINLGEKPFEGKFTYIPVKINGERRAYYLLAYGSMNNKNQLDVNNDGKQDFVQIVLKGPDDPEILSQMPQLEDLL